MINAISKVKHITERCRKARLRWVGHVKKRDQVLIHRKTSTGDETNCVNQDMRATGATEEVHDRTERGRIVSAAANQQLHGIIYLNIITRLLKYKFSKINYQHKHSLSQLNVMSFLHIWTKWRARGQRQRPWHRASDIYKYLSNVLLTLSSGVCFILDIHASTRHKSKLVFMYTNCCPFYNNQIW